jgi:carnitine 3-dehydrogenase
VLVRLLHALRAEEAGAGTTLARWERGLLGAAGAPSSDGDGPLDVYATRVPADWIDYNGHVHESRYLELFADASDVLLGAIGADGAYVESSGSYHTVETHLFHHRALAAGDRVRVTTQVLAADEKRLHVFHVLLRDGEPKPVATAEQMLLHVDAASGRAGPASAEVQARALAFAAAHEPLPRPERAGLVGAR